MTIFKENIFSPTQRQYQTLRDALKGKHPLQKYDPSEHASFFAANQAGVVKYDTRERLQNLTNRHGGTHTMPPDFKFIGYLDGVPTIPVMQFKNTNWQSLILSTDQETENTLQAPFSCDLTQLNEAQLEIVKQFKLYQQHIHGGIALPYYLTPRARLRLIEYLKEMDKAADGTIPVDEDAYYNTMIKPFMDAAMQPTNDEEIKYSTSHNLEEALFVHQDSKSLESYILTAEGPTTHLYRPPAQPTSLFHRKITKDLEDTTFPQGLLTPEDLSKAGGTLYSVPPGFMVNFRNTDVVPHSSPVTWQNHESIERHMLASFKNPKQNDD